MRFDDNNNGIEGRYEPLVVDNPEFSGTSSVSGVSTLLPEFHI